MCNSCEIPPNIECSTLFKISHLNLFSILLRYDSCLLYVPLQISNEKFQGA